MKRVVFVGGGFAGLRTARALAGSGLDVVVVDRQDHHLFTPLLYQVATASLAPEAIAIPLRDVLGRWPGVSFRQTDVHALDPAPRVADLLRPLPYDYLVLTAGAVRNYFGLDEVRRRTFDLKKLHQALALRDHILATAGRAAGEPFPGARALLLRFVIVGGGGPTGVEFAAAFTEQFRGALAPEYRGWGGVRPRVVLLEAADVLLPEFPYRLRQYALRRLGQLGVEVRLGSTVAGADAARVWLKDGSVVACPTLIWAAGVQAAPVADALPVPRTRAGRFPVLPDLTVEGHPEVYVLGDMSDLKQAGTALPMTAPVAVQQGTYAGRAIRRRERGKGVAPFRYRDMGSMAVLGCGAAMAAFHGFLFTGRTGWLVWFVLHLWYLAGFGNRLGVVLDWLRSMRSGRTARRTLHAGQERRAGPPHFHP